MPFDNIFVLPGKIVAALIRFSFLFNPFFIVLVYFWGLYLILGLYGMFKMCLLTIFSYCQARLWPWQFNFLCNPFLMVLVYLWGLYLILGLYGIFEMCLLTIFLFMQRDWTSSDWVVWRMRPSLSHTRTISATATWLLLQWMFSFLFPIFPKDQFS